jgi:hypothetical protein
MTLLLSPSSKSTYVQMARSENREEARMSLSSLLLIPVMLSPKNTYEQVGRGQTLCALVEPRHFTSHNFWEGVNCATHKKTPSHPS